MYNEKVVLCSANSYEQKYYLNPDFQKLPEAIKNELQIMCVIYTEDNGGILMMEYDEDGNLQINVSSDERDYLFDEIGAGLKIRQLQREKRELFEALEIYYKVVYMGMEVEE